MKEFFQWLNQFSAISNDLKIYIGNNYYFKKLIVNQRDQRLKWAGAKLLENIYEGIYQIINILRSGALELIQYSDLNRLIWSIKFLLCMLHTLLLNDVVRRIIISVQDLSTRIFLIFMNKIIYLSEY